MCVLATLEYLSILFCAVFWAAAPGYYYYYYYSSMNNSSRVCIGVNIVLQR